MELFIWFAIYHVVRRLYLIDCPRFGNPAGSRQQCPCRKLRNHKCRSLSIEQLAGQRKRWDWINQLCLLPIRFFTSPVAHSRVPDCSSHRTVPFAFVPTRQTDRSLGLGNGSRCQALSRPMFFWRRSIRPLARSRMDRVRASVSCKCWIAYVSHSGWQIAGASWGNLMVQKHNG